MDDGMSADGAEVAALRMLITAWMREVSILVTANLKEREEMRHFMRDLVRRGIGQRLQELERSRRSQADADFAERAREHTGQMLQEVFDDIPDQMSETFLRSIKRR